MMDRLRPPCRCIEAGLLSIRLLGLKRVRATNLLTDGPSLARRRLSSGSTRSPSIEQQNGAERSEPRAGHCEATNGDVEIEKALGFVDLLECLDREVRTARGTDDRHRGVAGNASGGFMVGEVEARRKAAELLVGRGGDADRAADRWARRFPGRARDRHHRHHGCSGSKVPTGEASWNGRRRVSARDRPEDPTRKDYVLALKGNQGTLHDDVELFVAEQKAAASCRCVTVLWSGSRTACPCRLQRPRVAATRGRREGMWA